MLDLLIECLFEGMTYGFLEAKKGKKVTLLSYFFALVIYLGNLLVGLIVVTVIFFLGKKLFESQEWISFLLLLLLLPTLPYWFWRQWQLIKIFYGLNQSLMGQKGS